MKFNLTVIRAAAALLITVSFSSIAAMANPDATQRVRLQDIAQGIVGEINPAFPVQLKVVNQTPVQLSFGSAGSATYTINPNASFITQIAKLPANLFVYIQRAQPNLGLNYDVSVNGNQVTVQAQPVSGDTPGDGAINIRRSGGVYIY